VTDPARAFGRVAREYELGRPSWPPEAIDTVVRELALAPDASVVDLGAGTGKLTRLPARDPSVLGAARTVVALA
jgi:hypothetical protein